MGRRKLVTHTGSNTDIRVSEQLSRLWHCDQDSSQFELRVKFLNLIPATWIYGSGKKITIEVIMAWASEWNKKETKIPRFVRSEGKSPAEIQVKFIGT